MKPGAIVVVIAAVAFVAISGVIANRPAPAPRLVTVAELAQHPGRWNGRDIRIEGWPVLVDSTPEIEALTRLNTFRLYGGAARRGPSVTVVACGPEQAQWSEVENTASGKPLPPRSFSGFWTRALNGGYRLEDPIQTQ